MTLSDLSINRPVFAWMVMVALIVFGWIGFTSMGISQLPDVESGILSVDLTWQGAAPEVMETDVVDLVEQSVMSLEGIKTITSSVSEGQASITIELNIDRNPDFALQEVQSKISQLQRRLPKDMDPPVVSKSNRTQQPIVWLALHGDVSTKELMSYVQDHLQDQFSTISGVGDIGLGGFVAPNLRVWIDQKKLDEYELTVDDVMNAITSQHSELPAGLLETAATERNVRAMGEAKTAEDFANISIPRRGGQPVYKPVYLKDVATIEEGLDDVRRISRSDGKMAVGLGIRKQIGSNEVAVSKAVYKKYLQVRQHLPKGMQLDMVINRSKYIEDSINELTFTLLLSAIVTSLVCWLFLGSWSATFNILMAIPTSIIGTFMVIHFLHFTLNIFTVLGLSLAIGIVVDDAIMVLENIVRYQEQGMDKVEAARVGARQITFAAFAATAAIIAIFLPVAFMSGLMGKFFFQFAVTISVAVALSLLEALMLTPMRCAQFVETKERTTRIGIVMDRFFHRVADKYSKALEWSLNRHWFVIIGSLIFFALSLIPYHFLRHEFQPPQDQSMFLVQIKTPVGSSLQFTNERFLEIEKYILSRPELDHYFAAVGGFGSGGLSNQGSIFVTFKQPHDRPIVAPAHHRLSQGELMVLFRKELNKIPHVKAVIQDLSLGNFSARRGPPIQMAVQGPQWEKLWEYTQKITGEMEKSSLLTDVDTDYLQGAKEVDVIPDRVKAAQFGVNVASINTVVNALIGGEKVAEYSHNDKRYDVKVRLIAPQRVSPEDILKLKVWNNNGELVELRNVVTISERPSAVTITRLGRQRAITISANVAPHQSEEKAITEAKRIAQSILPDDYFSTFTGTTQASQESNSSLVFVFILGIFVAYMVLASQFNDYFDPFTILMALPFSVSGALIALWLGGQSMNLYSQIGIILLMGIVKKNSILLVDFTNHMKSQGMGPVEALKHACPVRLRPILMTSAATIAAAIPPALAIGPGAEVRIPMSIAVIGGVAVSTFFTLFVVPCVYLEVRKIVKFLGIFLGVAFILSFIIHHVHIH